MLTAPQFVGLDNYAKLLGDERFLKALRNTAFYTLVSVPLGLALALGLASALNQQIRGIAWIRTAYFLPLVTSATAIALVWLWIYSPTGPLNDILRAFGIPPQRWVVRPDAGDALDHRDEHLAGPAGQHDHLPRRSPGHPGRVLRRRQRRRRGARRPVPEDHPAAADAVDLLHRACSP